VRYALPLVRGEGRAVDLDRTLAGAAAMAEIGVTEVSVPAAAFVRDGAEVAAWIGDLGQRWEKLWS
jgi:hypothetical protein